MGRPSSTWQKWSPVLLLAAIASLRAWQLIKVWQEKHWVHHHLSDQIIFTQSIASIARGWWTYAPFEFGITKGFTPYHDLLHFQPILAVFAPVYALFPSMLTLTVIEVVVALSACFPIMLIGERLLGSRWLGACFGFVFVFLLNLRTELLHDFHTIVLTIPFYSWAILFFLRERRVLAFLVMFGALLCKETEAFTWLFTGLMLMGMRWSRRDQLWGAVLAVGGVAWYSGWKEFLSGEYILGLPPFLHYYDHLGTSIREIALSPVLAPRAFWSTVLQPANGEVLLDWLWHFGGLWLLAPWTLIPALPTVAMVILGEGTDYRVFGVRYLFPAIPCVMTGAILTVRMLRDFTAKHINEQAGHVVAVALVLSWTGWCFTVNHVLSPFPERVGPEKYFRPPQDDPYWLALPEFDPEDHVAIALNVAPWYVHDVPHLWASVLLDVPVDYTVVDTSLPVFSWHHYALWKSLHDGYLPMNQQWRDGLFVLDHSNPKADGPLVSQLRQEMLTGYDFSSEDNLAWRRLNRYLDNPEPDGNWLPSRLNHLAFVGPVDGEGDLLVTMEWELPSEFLPETAVTVVVNESPVAGFHLAGKHSTVEILLACEQLSQGVNVLRFEPSDTVRPVDMGYSEDTREYWGRLSMARFFVLPRNGE